MSQASVSTSPILITGGAQRIGLALVEHFIEAGQSVIITYRTRHDVINELEQRGVICLAIDFDKPEAVELCIQQVMAHTESLRAIIHNASSWEQEADHADCAQLFDNMMRIHAKVPYLLNLGLSTLLNTAPQTGDIIHITDYVVDRGSQKHIAYAASKSALDNLTRSFAAKLAPKVKVNSIAPSLIIFNQDDSEDYKVRTLSKSVMGIEPGSHEIINAVEMILQSNYMTGRSIKLDGGRHLK
ncbi:dihydromonapterin reductase [Pseudoalteromonas sp. T1lg65]|uniref:dihydromonapterin reductase n=1 Tax=Pseudoalteromonas sp. T1lg65 TaxID=2077101 RepID=UPI003F78E8F2